MIVFFPNIAMRSFMQWWRARDFFWITNSGYHSSVLTVNLMPTILGLEAL